MKRRRLSVALLLIAMGTGAAGEAETIKLKPEQGQLQFTKVEKPRMLEAVFPITPTERRSFTASMKVDIYTWSHYGGIRAGFKSAKFDDRFEVAMSKGDDGMRSVAMDLEVAGGLGFRSTLCHLPPDVKSIVVTFKYEAPLSKFKMLVTSDNRVLGESDWKKLRGYFTQDEFFIRALSGKDGLKPGASLTWDQQNKGVHAVSQTGDGYILDVLIKNATIQRE
jgi:hypothetical protein